METILARANMAGPVIRLDELEGFTQFISVNAISAVVDAKRNRDVKEDIRLALVDCPIPNAIAYASPNLNLVAISIRLIDAFIAGAGRLLPTRAVQSLWNGENLESIPDAPLGTLQDLSHSVFFQDEIEWNEHEDVALLTQIAIWFVVDHELAHIISGHLKSGVLLSSYIKENGSIAVDRVTSRTLEMDADAFAIQDCMIWARRNAKRYKDGDRLPAHFQDDYSALRIVLLAIGAAMISMHASFSGSSGEFRDLSHPPGIVRFWSVGAVARMVFGRWRVEGIPVSFSEEALLQQVSAALFRGMLELKPLDVSNDYMTWLQTVQEHDRANLVRWAELRSVLVAAKYGSHHLAPAQF